MDLSKIKKAYLFGIGGIGVSAVARFFIHKGANVSGSDTSDSEITSGLAKIGANIKIGAQNAAEVPSDADLVIYSAAIEVAEPKLLKEIKKLKKPSYSYSEILGEISRGYKTIAISGTHGKTTTTAMIAEVLKDAGADPTVIVGSLFKDSNSNFIAGNGPYFIVEADEYREQFLKLTPHILVITGIGKDHLDYYGNLGNIQKAFSKLAGMVPKAGVIVADVSLEEVKPALKDAKCGIVDYREFVSHKFNLAIPGEHNRENAACALAVANVLGFDENDAVKSLESFPGVWRRFDFKGKTKNGVLVYDDYAHNPVKVLAAISGYREKYPKAKIVIVFQPHLYSRTKTLLKDFSGAFNLADKVIVLPIYAAREAPDREISSEILAKEIKSKKLTVENSRDFNQAAKEALVGLGKGDCIVTMGAGDVYKVADIILKNA